MIDGITFVNWNNTSSDTDDSGVLWLPSLNLLLWVRGVEFTQYTIDLIYLRRCVQYAPPAYPECKCV